MKPFILIVSLLLQLGISSNIALAADDGILIRSKAIPETPWLGQKVVLQLDLLVADGWVQVKKFPSVQSDSGYLIRYESQGTRLNEHIDGKAWSGQRYEFFYFPQRSGSVSIPAMELDIEVKKWGVNSSSDIIKKTSPPVPLVVKKTPGHAAEKGVIASTKFSASQSFEPQTDSLKVGDAISRSVTIQGVDVSAMLFAPLHFPAIEGVGVYPGQPTIKDDFDRGELTGKRLEKVSYVVEKPGTFQLPELRFSWWDINNEKLQDIALPGRTLTVAANPSSTMIDAPAEHEKQLAQTTILLIAGGMLCLLIFAFFLKKQLREFIDRWLKSIGESEQSIFRAIPKAARNNDPVLLLHCTMTWLDHISTGQKPARLDLFLQRYGNPQTLKLAEQLQNFKLFKESRSEIKQYVNGLRNARKKWRRELRHEQKADQLLPELHPHSSPGTDRFCV